MKRSCQTLCILNDSFFCLLTYAFCRINRNTITRVDTCTLNVLHDTRNKNILSIAYSINLKLLTHQIFIYKNRMLLCITIDNTNILRNILIVDCNLHTLTAKNV